MQRKQWVYQQIFHCLYISTFLLFLMNVSYLVWQDFPKFMIDILRKYQRPILTFYFFSLYKFYSNIQIFFLFLLIPPIEIPYPLRSFLFHSLIKSNLLQKCAKQFFPMSSIPLILNKQAIDILIYYLFQVCLLLRYCRLNNETHAIIHFSIRWFMCVFRWYLFYKCQ